MTMTATLSSYLSTGDVIALHGKEYTIIRTRSAKNYEARGEDGKDYLVPTAGTYTVVRTDRERALDILREQSKPALENAKFGTPVRITSGKFGGMVGILAHETSSRYYVAFLGKGTVKVPRTTKNIEVVEPEEFLAYAAR